MNNLILALKHAKNSHCLTGLEPDAKTDDLTPEKLQKNLQAFLKASARKTGFDKALLVRRAIKSIVYSKDKISIEWFYNRFSEDNIPNSSPDASLSVMKIKESNRYTQLDSLNSEPDASKRPSDAHDAPMYSPDDGRK